MSNEAHHSNVKFAKAQESVLASFKLEELEAEVQRRWEEARRDKLRILVKRTLKAINHEQTDNGATVHLADIAKHLRDDLNDWFDEGL